jgi:hypothetical protein
MMNHTHRNGVTVGGDRMVTGWWRCALLRRERVLLANSNTPQWSPNHNFILKCLYKKKAKLHRYFISKTLILIFYNIHV